MTWSAAKEPMIASGSRASTNAAARPIAAMESRGAGSASTCSLPQGGQLLAHRVGVGGAGDDDDPLPARGVTRSSVSWSRLRPEPVRSCRNFGWPARDSGHSRVPAPPAGMTAQNPGISAMAVRVAIPPPTVPD